MKTKNALIAASVALAFAASHGAWAKDKNWEFHVEKWNQVISYGKVPIADDSVSQWGPWSEFVEPAAGPAVPFLAATEGEPYRPVPTVATLATPPVTPPGTTPEEPPCVGPECNQPPPCVGCGQPPVTPPPCVGCGQPPVTPPSCCGLPPPVVQAPQAPQASQAPQAPQTPLITAQPQVTSAQPQVTSAQPQVTAQATQPKVTLPKFTPPPTPVAPPAPVAPLPPL